MRVALFSDHFRPELGGIQDSVECLARGLAANGHDVDLYVPRYSIREYQRAGLPTAEPDLGARVKIHRVKSLPYRGPTLQSRLALPSPTGMRLMQRPDIIHSHTVFGLGLQALAASKYWDVPLIATHHMAQKVFATYVPHNMLRGFFRYLRWYFNQCDLVSAPAKLVFDELGPLQTPHQIIWNAIDLDLFSPRTEADPNHPPTLIYAGKLVTEKRVDVLIQQLVEIRRAVPDTMLMLAGHGELQNELQARSRKLGIGEAVRFVGTLGKAELAAAFRRSDIFVSMSNSEVQSISQMQAMASGLPVVCVSPKVPHQAMQSPEYGVVTIEPEAADQFTASVTQLLQDPAERRTLAARASEAMSACSIGAITQRWETTYATVLEQGT